MGSLVSLNPDELGERNEDRLRRLKSLAGQMPMLYVGHYFAVYPIYSLSEEVVFPSFLDYLILKTNFLHYYLLRLLRSVNVWLKYHVSGDVCVGDDISNGDPDTILQKFMSKVKHDR
jgi:hypothetical protein